MNILDWGKNLVKMCQNDRQHQSQANHNHSFGDVFLGLGIGLNLNSISRLKSWTRAPEANCTFVSKNWTCWKNQRWKERWFAKVVPTIFKNYSQSSEGESTVYKRQKLSSITVWIFLSLRFYMKSTLKNLEVLKLLLLPILGFWIL